MKSAIFLTWFFTIIFFSHGLNGSDAGAGTSCSLPTQARQAAAINQLKPVELPPESVQAALIPAAYAATEVEPAAGEPAPRPFIPRAQNAQRYGADAESYYQDKQDHLLQALMK